MLLLLKGFLAYVKAFKYYRSERYDRAILVLNKALQGVKKGKEGSVQEVVQCVIYLKLYIFRGVIYETKGDLEYAFDDFCEAIIYMQGSEGVNEVLDKIIEEYPESSVAYYVRGIYYELEKDFDQSVADYSKAIKMNPACGEIYKGKASLLFSNLAELRKKRINDMVHSSF